MFAARTPNSILFKHNFVIAIFVAIGCVFSAKIQGYQIPVGYGILCCNLSLATREAIAFPILFTLVFINEMPNSNENASNVNNSSVIFTPCSAKTVSQSPLQRFTKKELIHMLETTATPYFGSSYPNGLIGQKVRYNARALRTGIHLDSPLPECGYFVIVSAYLSHHGKVLVRMSGTHHARHWDLATDWLEPTEQEYLPFHE